MNLILQNVFQLLVSQPNVELHLLTDIYMLLMIEIAIRRGIFHSIYRYAKANNKYMKDHDKNKESSYLQYGYVSNVNGCTMSQNLPKNDFDWIKDTSIFKKDFIKTYIDESG